MRGKRRSFRRPERAVWYFRPATRTTALRRWPKHAGRWRRCRIASYSRHSWQRWSIPLPRPGRAVSACSQPDGSGPGLLPVGAEGSVPPPDLERLAALRCADASGRWHVAVRAFGVRRAGLGGLPPFDRRAPAKKGTQAAADRNRPTARTLNSRALGLVHSSRRLTDGPYPSHPA